MRQKNNSSLAHYCKAKLMPSIAPEINEMTLMSYHIGIEDDTPCFIASESPANVTEQPPARHLILPL